MLNSESSGEQFAEFVSKRIPEIADGLFSQIISQCADRAGSERRLTQEFEERNYLRWKDAFDLIWVFIDACSELGERENERLFSKGASQRLDAVVGNHAKSILIAREIFSLMISGYADGALAKFT